MNWTERLSDWTGKQVTARIVDRAGLDPVSEPRIFTLAKLTYNDEQTHLQLYLNEWQFLSVPVFPDDRTTLSECAFRSEDEASQLTYTVTLG